MPEAYTALRVGVGSSLYKFPSMSRQEIEAMFSLSELKQTRVYQEGREEGREEGRQQGIQEGEQTGRLAAKLESIPKLLATGLTVEQIAQALDLSVKQVQEVVNNQSPGV